MERHTRLSRDKHEGHHAPGMLGDEGLREGAGRVPASRSSSPTETKDRRGLGSTGQTTKVGSTPGQRGGRESLSRKASWEKGRSVPPAGAARGRSDGLHPRVSGTGR